MNQKELNEIRRRYKLDKDSISTVFGCYVNNAGEIISRWDMSMGLMEETESEIYLKTLKKTLSGSLGKSLVNIEFSTEQVKEGEEHKLLEDLRQCELRDESLRETLYRKIIECVNFEDQGYVILLAYDAYDVPFKGKDDIGFADGSSEVFKYFICTVCPVKDAKVALRYMAEEKSFRGMSTGHVLQNPEVGFMYPAFDGRETNIYNCLYYCKNNVEIFDAFIKKVFNTEKMPIAPALQRDKFNEAIMETLEDECSLEVMQAVHGQIRERIQIHKESKEPDAPEIYIEEVDDILKASGISEERITKFNDNCKREFEGVSVFNPSNIVESKKFEMATSEVKITVDPEYSYTIETRVIDGRKYILIPATEGVTVNGIDICIKD